MKELVKAIGKHYAATWILSLGALAIVMSVFFDTAPDGTHNIGLLQTQMMIFQFGVLSVLSGTILYSVARILSAIKADSDPSIKVG